MRDGEEPTFAVTRNLHFAAALALFAAMQTAAAQTSVAYKPDSVTTRDGCPIEPHPVAINPDVVACHARFAPLPVVPPEINTDNPEHLEILRAKGDVLLRQLDRPEACGEGAKLRPSEACAILVYALDEEFRQAGLPWTYVVRIFRASQMDPEHLRETVLYTIRSNNSEGRFGPGSALDGEVWQLLADQRVRTRCKIVVSQFVRDSLQTGNQPPDQCRRFGEDARYHPVLLIGRGEAQKVLNPASITENFKAPEFIKR